MVSNSDIGLFKFCRRKWLLSSFNGRNLIPRMPNLKFWIGTGGHYALEMWYTRQASHPREAFEDWADEQYEQLQTSLGDRATDKFWREIDKARQMGCDVLDHYEVYAKRNDSFEFLAAEVEFSVPIPGSIINLADHSGQWYSWVIEQWGKNPFDNETFNNLYIKRDLYNDEDRTIPALFIGRMDGVIDSDRGVWIIDHKFMANLVDPETLVLNEQIAKYTWAGRVMHDNGWWEHGRPRGGIYNVIRKLAPEIPIKQKKGLSKNKRIKTTPELYTKWIDFYGYKIEDYTDILAHLMEREGTKSSFFQRLELKKSEAETDLVADRLLFEWKDMSRAVQNSEMGIDDPRFYPRPSLDCKWACSYKDPCYAANAGANAEYLLSENYETQQRTDLYEKA